MPRKPRGCFTGANPELTDVLVDTTEERRETEAGRIVIEIMSEKTNELGSDPARSMGNLGIGAMNEVTTESAGRVKCNPDGPTPVGKTYSVGALEFATNSDPAKRSTEVGVDATPTFLTGIALGTMSETVYDVAESRYSYDASVTSVTGMS